MGTIKVGRERPKTFNPEGLTVKDEADARKKRLEEIYASPLEEQLSLLIEAGFEIEAKELSERLSAIKDGHVDESEREDSTAATEPVDESSGSEREQPESASETPEEEQERNGEAAPKKRGRKATEE